MKYNLKVEGDSPDLDDSGQIAWRDEAWHLATKELEDCDVCRHTYNPDCAHATEKGK